MRTLSAAVVALAHADSRNMFAPAPVYNPAMNYGQMQGAPAYGAPVATLDAAELTYVQPEITYVQVDDAADGSAFFYGGAAALLGAVALAATRQQKSVAEPDLEAATSAANVAMLFSSGRSAPKKGASRGRKPAPKGRGAKKPSRSAPADDDDLFVHEGTKGFQGDAAAFVYRAGLAS